MLSVGRGERVRHNDAFVVVTCRCGLRPHERLAGCQTSTAVVAALPERGAYAVSPHIKTTHQRHCVQIDPATSGIQQTNVSLQDGNRENSAASF